MKKGVIVIFTTVIMILSGSCKNETIRLFTGNFTEAGEKGFYQFDLDLKEGTLSLISAADAGPNPSYFCISERNGLIYTVNEVDNFNGINTGGVTTLSYDVKSNVAEKINELAVPNGGPCYISLSPSADYLFMANYGGGSVAVIKLDSKGIPVQVTDTILYENEGDKVSHTHMISFDPAGERIYVTDLGLDRIVIYNFDAVSGRLNLLPGGIVKLPAGAGPRHFVFNAGGTTLYVINELNSTISVFEVDQRGGLNAIQNLSTLSEGFEGKSYCADIHISDDGKFLYGSNRGENTIVTFEIGNNGLLTLAGHISCGGNWPRNFVIDPSGNFLLVGNQKSDNISLFRIDRKNGIPIVPGKNYNIISPACLKFVNIIN